MGAVADEGMVGVVGDAEVVTVRVGAGEAACGDRFLASTGAFGVSIRKNSARFDDAERDAAAAQRAVVGRCGFPATVQMGSASLAQPPPPAEDAWAKQCSDDNEQQAVNEQAEVGHGRRSCEGESNRARVCSLPGEFSTVYVASTRSAGFSAIPCTA